MTVINNAVCVTSWLDCFMSFGSSSVIYLQVFSSFGTVLKIAMFDKNGGIQALVQYSGKWNWESSQS